MPLIVRAFPVTPGQEEAARQFAAELTGARRQEAEAFYRRFGIQRESWHLQDTPHGTWVIAVTDMSGEAAATGQAYTAARAGSSAGSGSGVAGRDRNLRSRTTSRCSGPPTEMLLDVTPAEAAAQEDV